MAIAAALVHDVGHGPFSHAFEEVGRRLELTLADHEEMGDRLIRDGDLAEALNLEMGSGFANDVADMIGKDGDRTIHNSVVSSQFDADRLDYMRRDRLMTGSGHSFVDFDWLQDNLHIEEVETEVDGERTGKVSTFVIGPKAIHAAEAYVLDLFQLYPTVYFHKTTRGAEKILTELLVRVLKRVRIDGTRGLGLPAKHPLVQFAKRPEEPNRVLQLDDAVIWGALSQLRESKGELIKAFSERLQDRKLFKCVDIRSRIQHAINPRNERNGELDDQIDHCCRIMQGRLREVGNETDKGLAVPGILLDSASRTAYKTVSKWKSQLEQINVKTENGALMDLRERSAVVDNIGEFKLTRAHYDPERPDICGVVEEIDQTIEGVIKSEVY